MLTQSLDTEQLEIPPPADLAARAREEQARKQRVFRIGLIRIIIVTNVLLGVYYLTWRYTASINWAFWPLSLALLAAETYSFIDGMLFGTTMWRLRERPRPPAKRGDETVDIFITCYNEPIDLVQETVRAAKAIRHPHLTWVLDDGRNPEMEAMADAEGVGYIVRSDNWEGHDRHAKAGNINNALLLTQGEFLLILDADQKPNRTSLTIRSGTFAIPAFPWSRHHNGSRTFPKAIRSGPRLPSSTGRSSRGKMAGMPHSFAAPMRSFAARR